MKLGEISGLLWGEKHQELGSFFSLDLFLVPPKKKTVIISFYNIIHTKNQTLTENLQNYISLNLFTFSPVLLVKRIKLFTSRVYFIWILHLFSKKYLSVMLRSPAVSTTIYFFLRVADDKKISQQRLIRKHTYMVY